MVIYMAVTIGLMNRVGYPIPIERKEVITRDSYIIVKDKGLWES